jgi:hypothetical protein
LRHPIRFLRLSFFNTERSEWAPSSVYLPLLNNGNGTTIRSLPVRKWARFRGEGELPKSNSRIAYERSDVPPRLVAALGGGLALSIAIVLGAIAISFPSAIGPVPRGPLQPLPPQPQLQSDPARDLASYREIEGHRLANYGWTADGHVRVPIEQAMNEVAGQGWSGGK